MRKFDKEYDRLATLVRELADELERQRHDTEKQFTTILQRVDKRREAALAAKSAFEGRNISAESLMPQKGEVVSEFDFEESANTLEA